MPRTPTDLCQISITPRFMAHYHRPMPVRLRTAWAVMRGGPVQEIPMKTESKGQHVGTVTHHELKQTLGTWQLWGIAVGLVISGEYFGWSYGWASAGTLGFVVTALFIAAMYTTFIFSFTELTTSIPHAGG